MLRSVWQNCHQVVYILKVTWVSFQIWRLYEWGEKKKFWSVLISLAMLACPIALSKLRYASSCPPPPLLVKVMVQLSSSLNSKVHSICAFHSKRIILQWTEELIGHGKRLELCMTCAWVYLNSGIMISKEDSFRIPQEKFVALLCLKHLRLPSTANSACGPE